MNNLDKVNRVISWRTHKNADGTFTGSVVSIDYKAFEVHAEYTRTTRAQAKSAAIKGVRFLKAKVAA